MITKRLGIAAAFAAALAVTRADAENADGILLGTEASLTGGAVLSTAHDPAGAFYNPAGLGALPASSLQLAGSVYRLSSFQLRGFVHTNLPWTQIDQTQSATDWNSVPSVAVYGARLGSHVGIALGVWVPSSESISFVSTVHSAGSITSGGAVVPVDYTQQIALTQQIERTYFGFATGLELRPGLRIGGSAFLVYERSQQFLDVFAAALTGSSQNGATASASIRGNPSQLAARLGLGVQWDLLPSFTVSAAVKTPTQALVTFGNLTTVVQSTSVLPGAIPDIVFSQAPASVSAISEPWRVAGGGAVAIGSVSLRGEVDWQAPRAGRHGVVNGRAGLYHVVTPDFTWGTGLFTDRSREDVRSGELALDYYGIAAGVDYRPPPVRAARSPDATWDVRASLAVRYAFGVGEVQRLEANPFTAGSPTPSTASVHAQSLSVTLGTVMQF